MAVSDYKTNPDENTTISGINIAEGCPPSGINNAIRQLMADVKVDHDAQESTNTDLANIMTGATASAAGTSGNVPAPAAGQQDFFLLGNAKWGKLSEQPDFVDLADRVTEAESKTALPLGHIFTWPFSTPPDGSIIVNGTTYSRELYSDLWTYLSSHPSWIKTDDEWQSIAAANNGYCPYFSSGDGSSTFRVPKFAPYQQLAISAANATTYHQAGLPNIKGRLPCESGSFGFYTPNEGDGALYSDSTGGLWGFASAGTGNFATGINIDASRFSDKYGRSDTVQPESHEWVVCIVAYGRVTNVGEVDVANVMSAIGVVQSNPNLQGTAHLRESWSDNSGGWYRIYSDGWCEQGGTVPAGQISATFYKPFIDMNFYINLFALSKNNTDIKHAQIIQNQISNASFNAYVVSYGSPSSATQDSNYYFKWEAKGFIRE